jgi:signal transduction histidine kinase
VKHPSLRARLAASLVLVATGAVLFAGLSTVLLVRRGEERAALSSLGHKADNIETTLADLKVDLTLPGANRALRLRNALDQLRSSVRVSDARLVFLTPQGGVATLDQLRPRLSAALQAGDPDAASLIALPDGLQAGALDTTKLVAGTRVTARAGNQVFVAQPLDAKIERGLVNVVVIGQEIDHDAARRAGFAFVVAGVFALIASFALSVWLARRLTRPLLAIGQTAHRLASGDLSARVAVDRRSDAELAAVAATLNRMAAELDAARNAERAFLQAVSHDLRTPLTSIRGYAEALGDGTLDAADPAARARAASVISTEARRLERLVRDLLDLSRLDAREFTLRPRPTDASVVVHESAAGFAPRATELGITLLVDASEPIPADVDADRLGQIVANLLENALKYARERVTVSVAGAPGSVVLRVADDGPGIPVDEQARVFDRLYIARNASARAIGTGLGLAIVRELTRAMGGDVHLEHADSSGTTLVATVAR